MRRLYEYSCMQDDCDVVRLELADHDDADRCILSFDTGDDRGWIHLSNDDARDLATRILGVLAKGDDS